MASTASADADAVGRRAVLAAFDSAITFDHHAGQRTNVDKTQFSATHRGDRVYLAGNDVGGMRPSLKSYHLLVGETITTRLGHVRAGANAPI